MEPFIGMPPSSGAGSQPGANFSKIVDNLTEHCKGLPICVPDAQVLTVDASLKGSGMSLGHKTMEGTSNPREMNQKTDWLRRCTVNNSG